MNDDIQDAPHAPDAPNTREALTPTAAVVAVPRPRRRPWRALRRATIVVVLAAAAASIGYVVSDKGKATPASEPVVLKTAKVTTGTLTTVEKIDGSLELSNTMNLLHRIEGQTSSAGTTNGSTSGASTPSGPSAAAAGFTAVAAGGSVAPVIADPMSVALAALAALDCPTADSTSPTADTGPCDTTTTTSTTTDAPSPTTDQSTTTTPSTADTSPPGATPPPSTQPTTSTLVADTTTTLAGGATRPGGGLGGGPATGGLGGGPATGGASTNAASSSARVTQTVTSVIADGSSVGLGDVLYTVDSQPVVALSGALPAWRTLSTSSDDGPDIQQLESSLVSLGYDPDGTVTVDNEFDTKTKAMVKRWQEGLGIEATGTVELGSVVFLPISTTVSSVSAKVGDTVGDGDTILTLTAATQEVVIDVPDGDESFVVPGLAVTMGSGTGTITLLRSVERDSAVVVQAVITPSAPIEGVANGGTITVTITRDALPGGAANVLIAPANALLSHIDGTYAVQVQGADGAVTWHTVELLGVSGNKVAIRGDGIADGTLVLVPV